MRQVDPKEFKINASSCHSIMTGNVGLSQTQATKLHTYEQRVNDPKGKPLTAKMEEERQKLLSILTNPKLPQGAKTFCQEWLTKQRTGRSKFFTAKQTEKGNLMEDWALEFAGKMQGVYMVKNESRLFTEWIIGTHDQNTGDKVVRDIKCPWDVFTFPYYETECPNKTYWWQLQCYMATTGCERSELVYVLANAPEHLIDKAAKSEAYSNGGDGVITEEIYLKHKHQMEFDDMDDADRIKVFKIERDDSAISQINARVELCRQYIAELQGLKI